MKQLVYLLVLAVISSSCGDKKEETEADKPKENASQTEEDRSNESSNSDKESAEQTDSEEYSTMGFEDVLGSYIKASGSEDVCWSSDKLTKIVQELKDSAELQEMSDMELSVVLPDSVLSKLNAKEKLEYALYYPESFYQNCNVPMYPTHQDVMLMAQLRLSGEDEMQGAYSQRQTEVLRAHKSELMGYLKDCLEDKTYVSDRIKEVVVDVDAYELIPLMLEKYQQQSYKDLYTLTACMLMMKQDGFQDFVESTFYHDLYTKKNYWTFILLDDKKETQLLEIIDHYYAHKMRP